MPRLYPRAEINLPVVLNVTFKKIEAIFNNLSADGALIRSLTRTSKKDMIGQTAFLKYDLANYGTFEHYGEIVWGKKDTYALRFQGLEQNEKIKLWNYILDNLNDYNKCPYCSAQYDKMPTVCKTCGWKLIFDLPKYIEYHQKRCLEKKLHSIVEHQSIEQIEKIISFVETNIIKDKQNHKLKEFVGTSSSMMNVFSKIKKVAATDFTLLIHGESGTGKDWAARAIHELSWRKKNPFIKINCAAIPEGLLEAELFGYKRGSFTGAYKDKKGKFEYAHGGTIFLDAIGEMPLNLQAKILRFLQERVVEKIGSEEINGKKVNVRVIATTSCDLNYAISEGTFRNDLYHRLATFNIYLPPVRDRGNDKVILARHFLKKFSREMLVTKTFTDEAIEAIKSYEWQGNVREIINKVKRVVALSNNNRITPEDLSLKQPKSFEIAIISPTLKDARQNAEKERLMEALIEFNHNISKVAKELKLSRQSIYNLKKKYSI